MKLFNNTKFIILYIMFHLNSNQTFILILIFLFIIFFSTLKFFFLRLNFFIAKVCLSFLNYI